MTNCKTSFINPTSDRMSICAEEAYDPDRDDLKYLCEKNNCAVHADTTNGLDPSCTVLFENYLFSSMKTYNQTV